MSEYWYVLIPSVPFILVVLFSVYFFLINLTGKIAARKVVAYCPDFFEDKYLIVEGNIGLQIVLYKNQIVFTIKGKRINYASFEFIEYLTSRISKKAPYVIAEFLNAEMQKEVL